MDSVITSLSLKEDSSELNGVDISALALDSPANEGQTNGVFAFGNSSTWSAAPGQDDSGDAWRGVLGSASRTAKVFDSGETSGTNGGPASFLSLSGTTWGTAGIDSGFAGLGRDTAD